MKKILAILIGALLLVSCSEETYLTNGTVVDTDYDAPWIQTIPQPNGAPPVNIYWEADCSVLVDGWTGGSEGQGEHIQEWHDDDCDNPLNIGDRWAQN